MKPRNGAVLTLVGLTLAACAQRQSPTTQRDLDAPATRCAAGDTSICEFLAQASCQSGELFACKALAENGEPAAWIDYGRLLCDRGACLQGTRLFESGPAVRTDSSLERRVFEPTV